MRPHRPMLVALTLLLAMSSQATAAASSTSACAAPPATMRAARIQSAGGPEALRVESIPTPQPAAGEVSGQIRINKDYIAASASGRAPRDEQQRRRRVRSTTVTGNVATAVIELDYPDMKALDRMSLLRLEDGWRIVVKAYEASTPTST